MLLEQVGAGAEVARDQDVQSAMTEARALIGAMTEAHAAIGAMKEAHALIDARTDSRQN